MFLRLNTFSTCSRTCLFWIYDGTAIISKPQIPAQSWMAPILAHSGIPAPEEDVTRCFSIWHMVISRCLGMTQNGKRGSSHNLDVGKTSWPLLAPNSSHSQTEHRKFLHQLVPDHSVFGVIPPCFSVWDGTSLPPIMVCQNWNHLQDMASLIEAHWILKKY